jgi:cytosine/adenosine deaminase-related metal-dependent hydrolase
LLGPDFQLVHPLGFTADERAAIVRAQAKICTSPVSELSSQQALNGYIQFAELAEAGAQIALSIDTLGSAGNGDFFAVMRALLFAHRQRSDTKFPLPPRRVLELATIEGATQLGIADRTGSLVPGKRADLILMRTTDANIAPVFDDPARAVVISGAVSNVDTVMVDGRILRAGGKFTSVDADAVAREATEAARSLQARLS